jgi:hypothetical protein
MQPDPDDGVNRVHIGINRGIQAGEVHGEFGYWYKGAMLGGTSVRVNAESIVSAPFHRFRRPTSSLPQSSARCDPVDDIHNSVAQRRCELFPYTLHLSEKPVAVDFPVLLSHSLPADMTAKL